MFALVFDLGNLQTMPASRLGRRRLTLQQTDHQSRSRLAVQRWISSARSSFYAICHLAGLLDLYYRWLDLKGEQDK